MSFRFPFFFAMCKCILLCRFFLAIVGHLAVLLKPQIIIGQISTLVHENVSLISLSIGMRFCFVFFPFSVSTEFF